MRWKPEEAEAPPPRFREFLRFPSAQRGAYGRRAFLLCLMDSSVCFLCYGLLNAPLNALTAQLPNALSLTAGSLLPALLGTGIAMLSAFLCRQEFRTMASAYRRLLFLGLAVFAAAQILLWGEQRPQWLTAQFFAIYILPPVLLGRGLSLLCCFLQWRREWGPEEDEEAEEDNETGGEST